MTKVSHMMSLLRIVLLFVFLTGTASAQAPARASAEPVPADRIVAVVNDEVITLYELRSRLEGAVSQLRRQGTPLPPRGRLLWRCCPQEAALPRSQGPQRTGSNTPPNQ